MLGPAQFPVGIIQLVRHVLVIGVTVVFKELKAAMPKYRARLLCCISRLLSTIGSWSAQQTASQEGVILTTEVVQGTRCKRSWNARREPKATASIRPTSAFLDLWPVVESCRPRPCAAGTNQHPGGSLMSASKAVACGSLASVI
jgi:hypothetical protein